MPNEPINWGFTLAVVLVGIVVVFSVLLILVAVCFLMGKLLQRGSKTPTATNPTPVAPAPVKAVQATPVQAVAPAVEGGITDDVVAAITAAIACVMGPDVPFAVTGIKRAEKVRRGTRPAWSNAGILDNTRPF